MFENVDGSSLTIEAPNAKAALNNSLAKPVSYVVVLSRCNETLTIAIRDLTSYGKKNQVIEDLSKHGIYDFLDGQPLNLRIEMVGQSS